MQSFTLPSDTMSQSLGRSSSQSDGSGREPEEGNGDDHLARIYLSEDSVEVKGDGFHYTIPRLDIIAVVPKAMHEDHYILDVLAVYHETLSNDANGQGPVNSTYHKAVVSGVANDSRRLLVKFGLEDLPPHLTTMIPCWGPHQNRCKIHCIVSTLSGTQRSTAFFNDVLKPLMTELQLEGQYETHFTDSDQSIIDLTTSVFLPRANEQISQTVIILSGDGGPADIVNSLLWGGLRDDAVPPVLGLLPLGTGNALAHSVDIMKDRTTGLRSLLSGMPKILPTFKVTLSPGAAFVTDEGRGRQSVFSSAGKEATVYGAIVFSWGLHASLVATSDTAEYRKHGVDRFKMAAGELLKPTDGSECHHYRGKITLIQKDDYGREKEVPVDRDEHGYVLATMVSHLEQHFCISPESKPLDGQMRLLHFGALEAEEIIRIFGLAYQEGKHVGEDGVGYEAIDGLRIDFEEEEERWRQVCVDGRIIVVERGGWLEVRMQENRVVELVVP